MFSIRAMCLVLEVSASGYYAWRRRMVSVRKRKDQQLQQRIRTIHLLSRQTYGALRIHMELREEGTRVRRKRVARLGGICRWLFLSTMFWRRDNDLEVV